MNLGEVFLQCFIRITCYTGGAVAICLLLLHFSLKLRTRTTIAMAFVAIPVAIYVANRTLHYRTFVAAHLKQNPLAPEVEPLTYEPSFSRLYASYQMNDEQFDNWRSGLGFDLGTYRDGLTNLDAARFGFETADLSIARRICTEREATSGLPCR